MLFGNMDRAIMAEKVSISGSQNLSGLPWWLSWERICLQCGRLGFDPQVRKIPWRRERQPTPVFLPGEFMDSTVDERGLVKSSL